MSTNSKAFVNRKAFLLENVHVEFTISTNLFSFNVASLRAPLRGYL